MASTSTTVTRTAFEDLDSVQDQDQDHRDSSPTSNAPAVPNVDDIETLTLNPIAPDDLILKDTATTIPALLKVSTAHEHRLSHTPSKLPALRLGDRGLLQAQNSPRSLPQPAVSGSSSGPLATAGAVSTTLTAAAGDTATVRAENSTSSHANASEPQLSPTTADASVPATATAASATASASASASSGPGAAHASGLPPLLHPVTESDLIRPPTATSADKRSFHSVASANAGSPPSRPQTHHSQITTPVAAKTGPSAILCRGIATSPTTATPANTSSPITPQSETGTDSSRYCTPASRPRASRTSTWDYSPIVACPPARRTVSWDSISVTSPLTLRTPGSATNHSVHGQRASTLPKAANFTLSDAHNKALPRRISSASRPPLSRRPLQPASAPGRIPPIRAFRSSGSRKSYPPDMNHHSSPRYYDDRDEYQDHGSRGRSLRALEGRYANDRLRDADHSNMELDDDVAGSDNNTADIFMTIAREDSSSTSMPRRNTDQGSEDEQSTVSRVVRTARPPRSRPQSTYSSTIQKPPSPPPVARRMSDQQVPTSRTTRRAPEEQLEQQTNRDAAVYQNSSIGRPSLKLDSSRGSSRAPALKPSPITPRTQSVLDNSADRNSIFARRPSTRTGDGHARSSSIKQPSGLSKSFNSSPLVPKTGVSQQTPNGQYVEASESSNSTAAPSTVWDELDELKSRIHRLELTGKLPKTSSAAISRTPEERPPTAGTGATTLSGSPKRAQTEIVSLASSHRETQSNLRSALSKTKPFLSSDVYDAIEAAANDALSLSQLMGTAGQAGPISSGASTIGFGGPSTVTDRQLRKKADSICRSLTELCIALKEEEPDRKTTSTSRPQTRGTSRSGREEAPRSPPMRVFNGTGPDEPLASIEGPTSPRVTRLDKRATFNFTGMSGLSNEPSPRYAASVIGGGDDNTMTGRKSSLVLARARRGVTEDPDDPGRKTSLLRTRRTASEEPEEQEGGRRSSMVLAPRRVTTIGRVSNIDEEPQMQSRAASRAFTEVSNARTVVGNGLRINVPGRDSIARRPMAQEPASASAALPRTRLITSGLPTPGPYSSRLMTPMTPTTPSGRRFLQVNRQQAQEDNNTSNITGRLAEERGQRYSIAVPPSSSVSRGPTLHRKRHSGIPSISGTASNAGGYR